MIKTIKKVILGSLSILGISTLIWTVFLLNPSLSYANQTKFDKVTVFHNQDLDSGTELVLKNAMEIIKRSALYDEQYHIELCLNDDTIYPNLHPFVGGPLAYALFNKTIIKNCSPKFDKNLAEAQWEINENELRKFDLTYLLAHEFTHNLQFHKNVNYVISTTLGNINWKLEGHAEYIARGFKQDGKLSSKIDKYLIEESNKHIGIPVFEIEDGTKQSLSYYKYALVVQYLLEIKKLDYNQICELETSLEEIFVEMVKWHEK